MKFFAIIIFSFVSVLWMGIIQADETVAGPSLYQRLGEQEGIESIVRKTIELHEANPTISAYVKHIDQEWLIGSVAAFFATGTGGPNTYVGTDMVTAHAHLDLNDAEFDAAVSDVLLALEANDIDAESSAEVNNILQSFRGAIATGQ